MAQAGLLKTAEISNSTTAPPSIPEARVVGEKILAFMVRFSFETKGPQERKLISHMSLPRLALGISRGCSRGHSPFLLFQIRKS
jgi:hypothetical protein